MTSTTARKRNILLFYSTPLAEIPWPKGGTTLLGENAARELGDRVHLDLLAGHLVQHLVGGHAHPGLPELQDERAGLALREPVAAETLAQVRTELRFERPRAQVAGDVEARVDVGQVVGRGGLDLQRVAEQLDVAV